MNRNNGKQKIRKTGLLLLITNLLTLIGISAQTFNPPTWSDDYSAIQEVGHYKKWGVYNIHDPSCIKAGDYYYMYTTDAYHFPRVPGYEREKAREARKIKMDSIGFGNIPIRRSKDLVNWEFVGWVLKDIPSEAVSYLESESGGDKPTNIWAPALYKFNDEYRLYYAISLFGKKISYMGMATAKNPEGPWENKGEVIKTGNNDSMNAIDASVIIDPNNGKHWMHYGSYFGGLFCMELDPETGLAKTPGDKGHLTARRADYKTRNLEAPEIVYNPEFKKYYLFTSYDALFTHYNVRVGRSDKPEGPFYDYFGKDLADTTNNYPILTYAYRFSGHPGWAGVAHCGVINDNGNFYMFHQGRLAPDNLMIDLHVREIFWTSDGWPVVSPERYAALPRSKISKKDVTGPWQAISLNEVADSVKLWQGQIPPGGWHYDTIMFNNPVHIVLLEDGNIENMENFRWTFRDNRLYFVNDENKYETELIVSHAWDWENKKQTIIFTGIKPSGIGLWGKKR